MSATLQNNVRLRFFIIATISLLIRLTRTHGSASIHKATGILENNFLLYALVVLCSLLPFKATWIAAIVLQIVAVFIDTATATLGTLSIFRCQTQTGCIQTLPMSVLTLGIVVIVLVLDGMQTWDIYRIIRSPEFISSSTQRIRILFAWALPFGWLVNIIMVTHSETSMLVYTTAHLLADPLVIIMANSHEDIFIVGIIGVTIILDLLAWSLNTHSIVNKAIPIQIALSVGALLILFAGKSNSTVEALGDEEEQNEFQDSEAHHTQLRQRKSGKMKIKF